MVSLCSIDARLRSSSSTAYDTSLFHTFAWHHQAIIFSLISLISTLSSSITLMPLILGLAKTPLWSSSASTAR